MINGIEGFLSGHFMDLSAALSPEDRELLKHTPGAYLGSCRHKLPQNMDSPVYPLLFEKLASMDIGALFYIGGNGSPDINDLSALMEDDYGILPFPKGDGQKNYTCILMNNRFYGLASNNSQAEDAGKVLVALGNRTYIKAAEWDKQHASYVRDEESLKMLRKIRSYDSIFRVTTKSFESNAAAACVDQKMTPKQAMEAIVNAAQSEINERFGV